MQATGLKGARLSFQQERLWSFQHAGSEYRVMCSIWLKGSLAESTLQQALQRIVEQHEILHTIFDTLPGMDVPVQMISRSIVYCPVIDLQGLEAVVKEDLLAAYFTQLQAEPFDLSHERLFHTTLFRLTMETHLLIFSLPALCADASTLPLMMAELGKTYQACLHGRPVTEEPLQYAAVSAWQRTLLATEAAKTPRAFWKKIDLSRLPSQPLPFDSERGRERNAVPSLSSGMFQPQMQVLTVDEPMAKSLEKLGCHYGVSLSAMLFAIWHVLLQRFTQEPDLVIGLACDGRPYEELTEALGPYALSVPIRLSLREDQTFEQCVVEAERVLQDARTRQIYFSWSTTSSSPGNRDAASFFPVTFEYERWPEVVSVDQLTISPARRFSCTEPFVLKLNVLHIGEHWQCELYYDPQWWTLEQIRHLTSAWHTLLQSALEQPQSPVSALRILARQEQDYLMATFCGPSRQLPALSFHQLFEAQAEQVPNLPAVMSTGQQLTYQELNSRANQLAWLLRRRGVGPNVLVGLCMERSAQMIVGLLGILKAGGAYLPLDLESPSARVAEQLQESQPHLLLTQRALLPRLALWQEKTLCLEEIESQLAQEPEHNVPMSSTGQDLAYVIYTSGSTGRPKGVMIEQQNLLNYSLGLCERIEAQPGWQYATVSTLAADLGNTAIMAALASGGCVQVLDYETLSSALAFERWVSEHPIDVLKIVPSHLSALLAGQTEVQWLPRQALILGGEVFPVRLVQQLRALAPTCRIYNHYGPTETTVGVLMQEVGEQESERVALGRPLSNSVVYVLDGQMQLVPTGVQGELYIGGAGVGRGYLGQGEQTAQRFVPDPYGPAGARLYRTGDLARYGHQGVIEFVGRVDSQVKLRGYRIELAEIEAALKHHPNVWDGCVVLQHEETGDARLVSYVVAQQQPHPTSQSLRNFLQEKLPGYMVPSAFVFLESLPLTANGKLDRQRLPRAEERSREEVGIVVGPRDLLEETLLEIWQDLLMVPVLSVHDNFFQLGGHSLLVTQVISRVRAVLQVELAISTLFESPTIAQLAERVERALRQQRGQEPEMPSLLPVSREQEMPLSFAQQRLWFLQQLEPESTTYHIPRIQRFYGELKPRALEDSIRELIKRHETLRTTFELREGQPVQVIHKEVAFQLLVIDMQGPGEEEHLNEVYRLTEQGIRNPFDLSQGPLLRIMLFRLKEQEHVLAVIMHHIISDAWSNAVWIRELTQLYLAFVAGHPSPLPPLPIQYADYAVWQRQWLQGEVLQQQLGYWKQQLAGIPALKLPTDYSRSEARTFPGATHFFVLSSSLSVRLKALGQQEGVTLFMILLAALNILLHYYTGQDDIAVGTDVANRNRAETEGLIGFFINQLVLRTGLSGNPDFREVLQRVKEVTLGAYVHQDLPFDRLLMELNPERDLSRTPLCQVKLILQNTPPHNAVLPDLRIEVVELKQNVAKLDMLLHMAEKDNELFGWLNYRTDLFSPKTVKRFVSLFEVVLEQAVSLSDVRLDELERLLREIEVKDEERRVIDVKQRNIQKMEQFRRKAR